MDDKDYQKILDRHIRKVKACLKRLQANSDNLKDLLTAEELRQFAETLSVLDKHVNSKINK